MAKKIKKRFFVADFETVNNPDDCRVWSWGLYNIYTKGYEEGIDIKGFMKQLFKLPNNSKIYFHNLKFDGEFIFYWLFANEFEHTTEYKPLDYEFTTLISSTGQFYQIRIGFDGKVFNILDSLKIIPMPVSKIAKAFKLDTLKGEIDYDKFRPIGYLPTPKERDYQFNDVKIVAEGLKYFFNQDLYKMTIGSNAMYSLKEIMGKERFKRNFPKLDKETDKALRKSYKGGWTYVNPKFQGKVIGEGIGIDENSEYPAKMYFEKLPYGTPIFEMGKYKNDEIYDLYIQCITCHFELKKDHVPTIQIKNNPAFGMREYATSSKGENIILTLTNVDLELFFKHYDVYNIEYNYYWKFKSSKDMFKDFIKYWMDIKEIAVEENNQALKTLAKLMLNNPYGKFATNPLVKSKTPFYDECLVKYIIEDDERDPLYVPVASYVTSYARRDVITVAQENYDRFLYSDTDSIYLKGLDIPDNLDLHPSKLGAWDYETRFKKAKFLRAKSYVLEPVEKETGNPILDKEGNQKLKITCAGMPSRCHPFITFDNFEFGLHITPGAEVNGKSVAKLQQKRVKGGVILKKIDYKLKE